MVVKGSGADLNRLMSVVCLGRDPEGCIHNSDSQEFGLSCLSARHQQAAALGQKQT